MTYEEWYIKICDCGYLFSPLRDDKETGEIGWNAALKYGIKLPLYTDIMKEIFGDDWTQTLKPMIENKFHDFYNCFAKKIVKKLRENESL